MFRGNIILFFIVYSIGLCASQGAGGGADGTGEPKYALFFDAPIYTCADGVSDAYVNTTGLEINTDDDTATIGGNMSFAIELPSKGFLIDVIAKKEVSGKFEVAMTQKICDLCVELHTGSDHWKYIKSFALPPECPFPPGIYSVEHFAPHKDDLPVNSGNAANYQVEIYIYSNEEGDCDHDENKVFLFCLKLDFAIDAV